MQTSNKTKESKKNVRKQKPLESDEDDIIDDDMEIEEIDFTKVVNPNDTNKATAEEDMDEEDKDYVDEEMLNVDFLFYDPNPNQFFSIKNLINGMLDGMSYKSSQLAELIVNQVEVGTMIGSEDGIENPKDRDIFSFATMLNLGVYKNEPVMQEILKFILEKSEKNNDNHEKLKKILDTELNKIGLLINERLVNLSPKLVPVLHGQLCEDVAWIKQQKDQDTEQFNFKYLIVISKCFKEIKASKKKAKTGNDLKEFLYPKFEDYEFLENSIFNFMFEAKTSKNISGTTNLEKDMCEQQCLRMILMLEWDKYVQCVKNLPNLVDQINLIN